jgi:hypothetical protein
MSTKFSIEETPQEFAREFLLGELIKSATNRFRYLEKTFLSMSKGEQEVVLRAVKGDIETAVRKAIDVIASDGRVTFHASCDQVAFKSDGVKAQLSMVNSDNAHALADAAGGVVMICIEDGSRYLNEGDATKGMADQKELV